MDIISSKLGYYNTLDSKAQAIAENLKNEKPVTNEIMKVIIDLYKSAKVEHNFTNIDKFESAYHSPITSELEFVISRILYHYSENNELGWKILLRKQKEKTAPDIRIERKQKTIAVIEIKAKAGWIQPFLSSDRFDYDMERLKNKKSEFNPEVLIRNSKNQLKKYKDTFHLEYENIYFLLPTLTLVHRKRYNKELYEYVEYFVKTSGLPTDNLILLSKNLRLNLSRADKIENLEPTSCFERMITKLKQL